MNTMVVARTASGRPSLQHKLTEAYSDLTECGLDVSNWGRAYMTTVIPQIVCKKCVKKVSAS